MGAWGTGVTQEDAVSDVIGHIGDLLKKGMSLSDACTDARLTFGDMERDEDEAPLLWLALASVQWKYGQVEPEVLRRVTADLTEEKGLDRWREDPKLFVKRKNVLAKFVEKIVRPNPKPSRTPRLVIRKAPFEPGDCLSVQTPDGRYTAALVLAADNSLVEHGRNLIAGLDYLESRPPGLEVFERRPWLPVWHGTWNGESDVIWYFPYGFRKVCKRITVVGKTSLRESDPRDSRRFCAWLMLGQQIIDTRNA